MKLFEDQARALAQVRDAAAAGHKRIMLQLPTGAGKTIIAAHMTRGARSKQKRVLFTVPFNELVDQTLERFAANGLADEIGVIQGDNRLTDWSKPIQIASVQTLQRRKMPDYDIALIDEAHRWFKFYEKWLGAMDDDEREELEFETVPEGELDLTREVNVHRDKLIVGLSATPWAKGLGRYYSKLVVGARMKELILTGRLSPFRVMAPSHPDLTGIKMVAGDFNEGQLSERMRKPDLVGDVVKTWQKEWGKPHTLVFAVDVAHAIALTEQFIAAGVATVRVAAEQTHAERVATREAFESGAIPVAVNVGVLTHGADWDVRCLVIARPTKSEILHVQIVGRALRAKPGKDRALILDHSDNHHRLGFVTDIHHAILNGAIPQKGRVEEPEDKPPATPKECPKCSTLRPPGMRKCPACGFEAVSMVTVRNAKGELVVLTEDEAEAVQAKYRDWWLSQRSVIKDFEDQPRTWFAQFRFYGKEKGYKPGWAANKFREKYGDWPPRSWNKDQALRPSAAVLSWLTSANIRARKRREKQERAAGFAR